MRKTLLLAGGIAALLAACSSDGAETTPATVETAPSSVTAELSILADDETQNDDTELPAQPTPTPTTDTKDVVAIGFGTVEVESSLDLGADRAEKWARTYVQLLADGDYQLAATLLASDGYRTGVRHDILPIASTVEDLAQHLADYCSTDGVCLPPLETLHSFADQVCGQPGANEELCPSPTTSWAYYDEYNDDWAFTFTLATPDGKPARFHPASAGPYEFHVLVGAENGQIFTQFVPPARSTTAAGTPAELRLPQIELAPEMVTFRTEVPGTGDRLEVWTDGIDLSISSKGGGMFTGEPYRIMGAMSGSSWPSYPDDAPGVFEVVVADDVTMIVTNTETGETLPLIARIPAPTIGNLAVWQWELEPWNGPTRIPANTITYTLADGTSFTEPGF